MQPPAHGYVMVPLRAHYTDNPLISLSLEIDGDRVDIRMWVATLSWSFTDLATSSGSPPGDRSFSRDAADPGDAPSLTDPVDVTIDGAQGVYRQSSLRGGHPTGYPVDLTVVWRAQCREEGTNDWMDLGSETRQYAYSYAVYAIRSRPG